MTSLKVNPLHYLIFSPIIITMPSRHTAYPQSKPPLISLLQICSISALSLHKKQSSTYNKYACGCFLYAPSTCIVYFQKRWQREILLRCYANSNPQRIRTGMNVQQLKIGSNGLTASIILRFLYTLPDTFAAIGDNVYRTGQYTIYYLPF